eukprot:scaffold112471_cov31-Tisochrysis_lutea.AAC.4
MSSSSSSDTAAAVAEWLERKPGAMQWEVLPASLRTRLGSESAWLRAVRGYCAARQRAWCAALGLDEKDYLIDLLRHSREHLMLYPYHLAERLTACVPASSPFE